MPTIPVINKIPVDNSKSRKIQPSHAAFFPSCSCTEGERRRILSGRWRIISGRIDGLHDGFTLERGNFSAGTTPFPLMNPNLVVCARADIMHSKESFFLHDSTRATLLD